MLISIHLHLQVHGSDELACYHPQCCQRYIDSFTGEVIVKYRGPIFETSMYGRNDPSMIIIPCGKCVGCMLDYSRSWADRCLLELDHAGKGIFLTLTYDDLHVPITDAGHQTLDYRHVQLFNHRLRKFMKRKLNSDLKLRFYCSGEYGSTTLRPHYHMIAFGLSIDDFPDFEVLSSQRNGKILYKSDFLNRLWSHGHVVVAGVSWQTCAYVARYTAKKLGLKQPLEFDQVPPFSKMSLKPGLGGYFLEDHPDYIDRFKDGEFSIWISDPDGVKKHCQIRPPKKILDEIAKKFPEDVDTFKEKNYNAYIDSLDFQLSQTDKSEFEYRQVNETYAKLRTKKLKRSDL